MRGGHVVIIWGVNVMFGRGRVVGEADRRGVLSDSEKTRESERKRTTRVLSDSEKRGAAAY